MGTRRVANLKETIAVNDLLSQSLEKAEGGVFYANGETDAGIAAKVSETLSVSTVIRIREEMHGKLVKPDAATGPSGYATVQSVALLNSRVWVGLEALWGIIKNGDADSVAAMPETLAEYLEAKAEASNGAPEAGAEVAQ